MSKAKGAGGRPVLYGPKDGPVQVRSITKEGARIMDQARKMLKKVHDWPGKVSDGDVIDFVLRFWRDR